MDRRTQEGNTFIIVYLAYMLSVTLSIFHQHSSIMDTEKNNNQ